MDRFDNMRVFAKVVESSSFTGAAARLGISASMVSQWTCRRRRRRFALWTSKAGGSGEAHASLTPEQSQHAC